MQPTLFSDVDNSMRAAREEIFGPVVCLLPYGDEREAVRIADDSESGRSGSVWTVGIEHGTDIARRIRTGTYSVHTFSPDMLGPFGGYQTSGLGRAFGPRATAPAWSTRRSTCRRGPEPWATTGTTAAVGGRRVPGGGVGRVRFPPEGREDRGSAGLWRGSHGRHVTGDRPASSRE